MLKGGQITLAAKLLREGPKKHKGTNSLNTLFEQEGIGTKVGLNWLVSERDLEVIGALLKKESSVDPRKGPVQLESRVEQSKTARNEKITKGSVFGSAILMARNNAKALPVLSEHPVHTPDDSFLGVHGTVISSDSQDTFIVVENGQMMSCWSIISLPGEILDPVWIYKGHGTNQRFIRQLSKRSPLIAYFDFDLAGLCMAHDLGFSKILVPADFFKIPSSDFYAKFNKITEFHKQYSTYSGRINLLPQNLQDVAFWMVRHKIAITQEHLTTHGFGLEVLNV